MGAHDRLTTVISTEGQVILPKAIRDLRHWPAGTLPAVEDTPDGVLLKALPIFRETDLDAVFGSMRYEGPPLTLEDMGIVISTEAKRRARD